MVKDGIYYGIAFSAAGALLWYLIQPAFAAPLFLLALFCLYFFRDPDRAIPDGPVAVSPADGKVVANRRRRRRRMHAHQHFSEYFRCSRKPRAHRRKDRERRIHQGPVPGGQPRSGQLPE